MMPNKAYRPAPQTLPMAPTTRSSTTKPAMRRTGSLSTPPCLRNWIDTPPTRWGNHSDDPRDHP